jgi:DNA replication protein DnaC
MLIEETFQKLSDMRMHGFARALREQLEGRDHGDLSFDERLNLLVDREWTEREGRSLTRRLQLARLRHRNACVEDIDYRQVRGLDRSLIKRLATAEWITKHQNLIVTGKTGCGKTFIACALAQRACRDGRTALYRRVPRLLNEIAVARADGSYPRLLSRIAKTDVLVLDDWGLAPLGDQERRDMLEVLEDRTGSGSTIVTSQLAVKAWHEYIGEPTIADAVLDRLVHNAHRIELKGPSMRRKDPDLTKEETSDMES